MGCPPQAQMVFLDIFWMTLSDPFTFFFFRLLRVLSGLLRFSDAVLLDFTLRRPLPLADILLHFLRTCLNSSSLSSMEYCCIDSGFSRSTLSILILSCFYNKNFESNEHGTKRLSNTAQALTITRCAPSFKSSSTDTLWGFNAT